MGWFLTIFCDLDFSPPVRSGLFWLFLLFLVIWICDLGRCFIWRPLEPTLEPMKIATPETSSPQSTSSTLERNDDSGIYLNVLPLYVSDICLYSIWLQYIYIYTYVISMWYVCVMLTEWQWHAFHFGSCPCLWGFAGSTPSTLLA